MKKIMICVAFALGLQLARGQNKIPGLDRSPMDMSYYPPDYPILKIQDKANEPLVARIIYGRPQRNDRTIFGDLVPYGSVWRLGANEATEIEFFKDVKIDGKKVPKGRYTMYAMPDSTKWTIIINKETNIWGAFKYDQKQDVIRTELSCEKRNDLVDIFTMLFEKNSSNSANLLMTWENILVRLPFSW
ncbi:MAG TPA: DUF2911 domain-containing protein [Puia sp.]|nr:DUF2911 domain-containing protein [Puia sp.]